MESQGAVFAEWLLLILNPMAVLSVSTAGRDEATVVVVGRKQKASGRLMGGFAGNHFFSAGHAFVSANIGSWLQSVPDLEMAK